jgi:hypothetical protein
MSNIIGGRLGEPVLDRDDLQVTLVVVPRERFSQTQRSLESLYEHTTLPFHLIYVDAGTPPPIRHYLEMAAKQRPFQLIQVDRFLSPNQARNLAQRHVQTKYVVFLDNDALVTPGWLEKLVACAEETGAWIVGPLYLIGEFSDQRIHMAGGVAHVKEQDGERIFYDEHRLVDTLLADLRSPLQRQPCNYVEFHCVLIRNEVFQCLGPLDEQLLSLHEHIDLGLLVHRAGGAVYIEPAAVTTYIPPAADDWRDLPYFMMRWSDAWNRATLDHFKRKWGYSRVWFFGDETNLEAEETILRWARGHRRFMAGMQVSAQSDDRPQTPYEEALCMVALFLSVDRESFELLLETEDGHIIEESPALDAEALLNRLSGMLARAEAENLNCMLRLISPPVTDPVTLLRLDDLDREQLGLVRPHAFLILETGREKYQCWLAVTKTDPRSAAVWRRLGMSGQAGEAVPFRVAGSKTVSDTARQADRSYPRVRLFEGHAGLLNPLGKLEDEGLLPLLRYGRLS